jgi:dTDP-4-amino-4,6-dideoxygalactose transaminase
MLYEKAAISVETPAIYGGTPVCSSPVRFIKPTLPPLSAVLEMYTERYNDGTITNADLVRHFEHRVEEYCSVPNCIAVSSCTSGLALILRAFALKRREVILPSFTFFATGHAVLWNGLTPVFADCDSRTWTIDPESVESVITKETGAIIGVHLYGNPCNIAALERVATKHNLRLIFDSAHAFGSRYQNRPIGQFGDAEVFSLSPTKLLVAGEGGLVTTNDTELARKLRAARNYGDLGTYDPEVLGLNARMSEFNAALGTAGLQLVASKVERHNAIAALYTTLLSEVPGMSFQHVNADDVNTFKDFSVSVDSARLGMNRDRLAEALLAENVTTKKYFSPPLHKQMLYRHYYKERPSSLPHTDRIADTVLSLPIYESISDETVKGVARAIKRLANDQGY